MIGGLAPLVDTTIVAVGLHTLSSELNVSVGTIQWVTTGYLLALGVVIPLTGWAQRVLGAKRLWMLALALFLSGSILSSLAWNAGSLITFRVLQGIGGGIIIPLTATLVTQAAGGKHLNKIMSVVAIPGVLGPIFGPVLGGLILQHLHWSWMFWVNVPFCVIGLILAAMVMPKDRPMQRAPLDVLGFVLMALGLVNLLWGLSNASKPRGFGRMDVFVPCLIGLVLVAAFLAWALRRGTNALLDLPLLKHRTLAFASILLFLSSIVLYGAMLLLPLYFQQLRDATVFGAALLLIPQGIGTFASQSVSSRLSELFGSRLLAVGGFFLTLVGTVPFAFAGPHTDMCWLMIALFVRGLGLGVVTVPLITLGYRGLKSVEVPDASIFTRIATQVGGAFGSAVLIVVLAAAARNANSSSGLSVAFQHSFWWAIGFTAVGMLLSFALPGRHRGSAHPGLTKSPQRLNN